MKKMLCLLCTALLALNTGCGSPNPAPDLCREPPAADFAQMFGALDALPEAWDDGTRDLRSTDLRSADLSGELDALLLSDFDSQTLWPDTLPDGFDPAAVMEQGKNPGLGVRALHEKGITGKGVGIAIIDQTLLTGHQEYADRLRCYREYGPVSSRAGAQMHGAAVASIAAGKTVGVAPDALLYFFACDGSAEDGEPDLTLRAQTVDEIIALNSTLPAGEKIRVISMSRGWMPDTRGAAEMQAAVKRAQEAGIAFVYVADNDPLLPFMGSGRLPLADPEAPSSVRPGMFWEPYLFEEDAQDYSGQLLIPMDRRATASPTGEQDYVFYNNGGMSWAVPYVAGLYALACQAQPGITFELFVQALQETSRPATLERDGKTYSFGKTIDPAAMIERVSVS